VETGDDVFSVDVLEDTGFSEKLQEWNSEDRGNIVPESGWPGRPGHPNTHQEPELTGGPVTTRAAA